ncbi:MAG: hypothetical protein BroJett030_09110 [Alphaproteobacteria bacterium]|nr:MAG: hypothetical protein BroJett030_09110 [Alphaproteobacteria bacterium]
MNELLIGFGVFLVLEGLLYAAFPAGVKRIALEVPKIPDATLRNFGIIAMMIGVGIVWLVRNQG